MVPTTVGEPGRIEVPDDARDLPGTFPHRLTIDVRLGDTDAMGHMNNARYLTFCESARVEYWERVTGRPFPVVTQGATESMILADIRVTFRSPVFVTSSRNERPSSGFGLRRICRRASSRRRYDDSVVGRIPSSSASLVGVIG